MLQGALMFTPPAMLLHSGTHDHDGMFAPLVCEIILMHPIAARKLYFITHAMIVKHVAWCTVLTPPAMLLLSGVHDHDRMFCA